jgi:anti-sigma B factor antagonist
VFSARERAETAYQELISRKVPADAIVFLTRSDTESKTIAQEMGATVGGFMGVATGMSAGVGAAVLLMVPGIGQVFALGFGAAALLGLAGAGAGSALGKAVASDEIVAPTPDENCSEDVAFFREVLAEGRSLLVVRSESQDITNVSNEILNRLGIAIQEHTPVKLQTSIRQVADVAVIDVSGRITVGEGSVVLRDLVREVMERGNQKILLNLHNVGYVDSSGLGELVKAYTTVRKEGRQLKLVDVSKRVSDLLHMTKLNLVLEIEADEASAVQSFRAAAASSGAA